MKFEQKNNFFVLKLKSLNLNKDAWSGDIPDGNIDR